MDIEGYSQLAVQYYRSNLPSILLNNLPSNFKTVLDCGCGDGSRLFSLLNSPKFKNKKIYAIDLSKSRISLIKKYFGKLVISNVDNAEQLSSITDKSIDIFISEQVIEHVDDQKMIRAINRVTKLGSLIYLSTVIKSKYGWYFYKNSKGDWSLDPTHLREYPNLEAITKLFPSINYQIIEQTKNLFQFSILEILFKYLKVSNRHIFNNWLIKYLRFISFPVLGYYKAEILLLKIK